MKEKKKRQERKKEGGRGEEEGRTPELCGSRELPEGYWDAGNFTLKLDA